MKVTLNNIGKKYESREDFTLRHINLEIEDKDFCVILGPSGCGKTTLSRMLGEKLNRPVIDIDEYIVEKYHQTIIIITHDNNIAKLANRVITIKDGKIISDLKRGG